MFITLTVVDLIIAVLAALFVLVANITHPHNYNNSFTRGELCVLILVFCSTVFVTSNAVVYLIKYLVA